MKKRPTTQKQRRTSTTKEWEIEERARVIFESLKRNKKVKEVVKKVKSLLPGKSLNVYKELKEIIPLPWMTNAIVMAIIASEKGVPPDKFLDKLHFKPSAIDIVYHFNGVHLRFPWITMNRRNIPKHRNENNG
jgi:hypothetical protein